MEIYLIASINEIFTIFQEPNRHHPQLWNEISWNILSSSWYPPNLNLSILEKLKFSWHDKTSFNQGKIQQYFSIIANCLICRTPSSGNNICLFLYPCRYIYIYIYIDMDRGTNRYCSLNKSDNCKFRGYYNLCKNQQHSCRTPLHMLYPCLLIIWCL